MLHHLAVGLRNMLKEQAIRQQYKKTLSEIANESDQQDAKKLRILVSQAKQI